MDSRCLKMAPDKTEALLVTDRRSFQYPRIVLGEHEVEWEKTLSLSALKNHAIQKKLFSAQRGMVLRMVSAYKTVSMNAVHVMVTSPRDGHTV